MNGKKMIKAPVEYNFDWAYGVSIAQMREDLDAMEQLGVTEIDIEPYEQYENTYISIKAYVDRLETDTEYSLRKSKEKADAEKREAMERATFERLAKKYMPDPVAR